MYKKKHKKILVNFSLYRRIIENRTKSISVQGESPRIDSTDRMATLERESIYVRVFFCTLCVSLVSKLAPVIELPCYVSKWIMREEESVSLYTALLSMSLDWVCVCQMWRQRHVQCRTILELDGLFASHKRMDTKVDKESQKQVIDLQGEQW